MAKFTWSKGEVSITLRVGEMSRAAALDCARDFEPLLMLPDGSKSVDTEIELLFVKYAPAAIIAGDKVITQGDYTVNLPDGGKLLITLPMTRECFNELPVTLTREWGEHAAAENAWVYQDLKNALSRILQMISVPESGSESSQGEMPPPSGTKTSGESDTQTSS